MIQAAEAQQKASLKQHQHAKLQSQAAYRLLSDLQSQLFQHLVLGVLMAQVAEVDQRLVHGLVACQGVGVLHGFPHNVAILILHNNDLLGLRHACNHQPTQLGQDTVVQVLTAWGLQQEQSHLARLCLQSLQEHVCNMVISGLTGMHKTGCSGETRLLLHVPSSS